MLFYFFLLNFVLILIFIRRHKIRRKHFIFTTLKYLNDPTQDEIKTTKYVKYLYQ